LAIRVATQVLVIRKGSGHPKNAHGELEDELNLHHKEAVEEVSIVDKGGQREDNVVAKVEDRGGETEDDHVDERPP
jgi:hypothetical protein